VLATAGISQKKTEQLDISPYTPPHDGWLAASRLNSQTSKTNALGVVGQLHSLQLAVKGEKGDERAKRLLLEHPPASG
jgi:hypothetical protein